MEPIKKSEVVVRQYLRPKGAALTVFADVGEEFAEKARKELLVISSEVLNTGEIAIYVRKKSEPEEDERMELAENGPGENSPTNVLRRMIGKEVT